jgi:hypothetical protein
LLPLSLNPCLAMTFDARSKERLEALGRTLPKKLPPPEPSTPARTSDLRASSGASGAAGASGASGGAPRHPLEREQDPAELFRALIAASPDGTVPPHLLDRLRELESSPTPAPPASPGPAQKTASAHPAAGPRRGKRSRRTIPANDDQDLYTAFAQLLLEDDDA